ncbi:MAG: Asp23/Gls24 family envelope stress response protein [Candidatus Omnitrophota bacterium]
MLQEEEKTHLGVIKIHNNVIASIAVLAAQEVEGISKICDNIRSKAFNLLGKKEKSEAIEVRSEKDGNITIIVPVIVKFGHNIPEVALALQEKIKAAVEEATDITPKDIVIQIKGVEK